GRQRYGRAERRSRRRQQLWLPDVLDFGLSVRQRILRGLRQCADVEQRDGLRQHAGKLSAGDDYRKGDALSVGGHPVERPGRRRQSDDDGRRRRRLCAGARPEPARGRQPAGQPAQPLDRRKRGTGSGRLQPGQQSQRRAGLTTYRCTSTLRAGTYVMEGNGFSVQGNATVTVSWVTIYVTCDHYWTDLSNSNSCSGNHYGSISITGAGGNCPGAAICSVDGT